METTYEIGDMQGYVRWTVYPTGHVECKCFLMNMYCQELDILTADEKTMAHILVPFVKTVVQQLKETSTYRDISMYLTNLPTQLTANKYANELTEYIHQYYTHKSMFARKPNVLSPV